MVLHVSKVEDVGEKSSESRWILLFKMHVYPSFAVRLMNTYLNTNQVILHIDGLTLSSELRGGIMEPMSSQLKVH